MSQADVNYRKILIQILQDGVMKGNRTGTDCLTIAGAMFEHDMADGFPLLTIRKLPYKSTFTELEFFIKGLRSKKWLQDRGCKYWDEWANPQKVPYGTTDDARKAMREEDDLGLVYGTQWRDFHDPHSSGSLHVDQLKQIVQTLKKNPSDRRMICTAWNPPAISQMALPPCHYSWQVTVIDGKLNLAWNQRSCDYYLGIPANIASYALLLHLLAKEAGLKEGKLIGFFMDVHLYENHLNQARELVFRKEHPAPTIETDRFTTIFMWEATDTFLINYSSEPPLTAPISI